MKKSFFSSLIFVLILAGCKKTEVAPSSPAPTGTIEITALGRGQYSFICNATNADTYTWDSGDKNGNYYAVSPVHQYQQNGSYIVSVTLRGKGGIVTIKKAINVNDCYGAVTIWTSNAPYIITVTVGGRNMGTITSNYNSAPDCGASGTAWSGYSFAPGTYSFSARETRNNGVTWSGSIRVTAGACQKLQLTF